MYPKITHAIFDLDGLLLDTEPFYTQAANAVLRPFGKRLEPPLKARMMGRPALEAARILLETLGVPMSPEEYTRRKEEVVRRLYPQAKPRPGAVEVTRMLEKRGIPMAVATSTRRADFLLKTQHHRDWFSRFQVVVTGDNPELKRGKPHPDIYLLTARRLGTSPEHCLVFEDAPSGVQAALAAGMWVVVVPDPSVNPDPPEGAHWVLTSLEEFDLDRFLEEMGRRFS